MITILLKTNAEKILDKYRRFALQLAADQAIGFGATFRETHKADYRLAAQTIIFTKVYQAYVPKKYVRTGKLLLAPQLVPVNKNQFTLNLNPEGLESVRPKEHSHYPAYVIAGITTGHATPGYPKRNFQKAWNAHFQKVFARDFNQDILRPLR